MTPLFKLAGLLRPYWRHLLKGVAMSCGIALLAIALPYLGKILIDEVYPSKDLTLAGFVLAGILAARLAHSLLVAAHGLFDVSVGTRIVNALSMFLLDHVQRLPLSFFDSHATGAVQSRFQDIKDGFGSLLNVVRTVAVQGLFLVVIPPLLFFLEWRLAVVALLVTPLVVASITLTRRRSRQCWEQADEATESFDAFRTEIIANIRLVKSLALEGYVCTRGQACAESVVHSRTRAGGLSWALAGWNYVVSDLDRVLYMWLGWHMILAGQLSLGTFLAFEIYVGLLHGPLSAFVNLNVTAQKASVQLARVFEFLDTPKEDQQLPLSAPGLLSRTGEGFELRNVGFGYSPENAVLHSINAVFKTGQTSALIGPSGCGKSTVLQLLMRLRHPTSGIILYQGLPLHHHPVSDLRRAVTLVTQDTQLLKGSLWDNLVLARQDATFGQVEDAVELCCLAGWVRDLPAGLDTPIAEWGASLSGGQKQRIALARALLKDAPVLLLDEATAHIDFGTEEVLLRSLLRRYEDRLLVFVTHRTSTAYLADQVVVMDNGRIAAFGPPGEQLSRLHGGARQNSSILTGDGHSLEVAL